ncbi:MAG: Crp/Fnr family transcriptional regulator [Oscillospiraceae bacterium]|nr:Crp/Fnr family transcriptional regulator [Oscillospiraceae bacterium]
MEKFQSVLCHTSLFAGMAWEETKTMLNCLGGTKRFYPAQSAVRSEGETITQVGVVLSGQVQIIYEDLFGHRSILKIVNAGEVFGEAMACMERQRIPFGVWTQEDSEILFLDYKRVIHTCSNACVFHQRLIANLVFALAEKNLELNQKIRCLSKRSTREKLLMYLSAQAKQADGPVFQIPFDRQSLADYLCVDRSAMSAELSKLKREGILDFHRSTFRFSGTAGETEDWEEKGGIA